MSLETLIKLFSLQWLTVATRMLQIVRERNQIAVSEVYEFDRQTKKLYLAVL